MKKLLCILSLLFILLLPLRISAAEESYSHLFISVGDAIMNGKAENWSEVETALQTLTRDWQENNKSDINEEKLVDKYIKETQEAVKEKNKDVLLKQLSNLSNALVAYEKAMNPVDKAELRNEFKTKVTPALTSLQEAIRVKNAEEMNAAYKKLLTVWTKNEGIVRDQSIEYYGQIETQMGFLRIAILKEDKSYTEIQKHFTGLSDTMNSFASGAVAKTKKKENHSLQTLIDLLDQAISNLDQNHYEKAIAALEEFLTVWPTVEGEVQTRNGALYKELENNIPIIAGKLSASNTDPTLKDQLKEYKQELSLLQKKNYTVWDAALIMLREGLEALLIVSALIAFLRKTDHRQYEKWIWLGASAGILLSVLAAIVINSAFSSAMAGANREILEGTTGIIAVIMMLGVGVWLHQKSQIQAWNKYIQAKVGKALSTGSVLTLALISFLSIFREGAETLIFYGGMAPSISAEKLVLGIAIAFIILLGFTWLLIRYSTKIPMGTFFKGATMLIYLMAFKILGVSVHALQLTSVVDTHLIRHIPIIDIIGFFPTLETIIPQCVLIGIMVLAMLAVKRKQRAVTPAK